MKGGCYSEPRISKMCSTWKAMDTNLQKALHLKMNQPLDLVQTQDLIPQAQAPVAGDLLLRPPEDLEEWRPPAR